MNHNMRVDELPGGIVVLSFDRAGSSANVFDRATLAELRGHLERLRQDTRVSGVIFQSAKPGIFMAGADLHELRATPPDQIRDVIRLGQETFNAIAQLRMPTVAAIHGACLGGGLEMALACTWRVASDDRRTKVGLPETSLGLIPAWGGSTRLPRLIGLPRALGAILTGKQYAAKHARQLGIIDEVVATEQLLMVAQKCISAGKKRRRGYWLVNNPVSARVVAAQARRRVAQRTRGHYPAAAHAVDVVSGSVTRPFRVSLAAEAEALATVAQTDVCRQLVRLFFLREKARKLSLGMGSARPPRLVAVIGAGMMGAGIAQWLSARGLQVILRDISPERVAQGMAAIRNLYGDAVRHRLFTPREAQAGLDRILPTHTPVPLARADWVIEAATENLELKRALFRQLGAQIGPDTVLATNTSALPVGELGREAGCPGRVVGLHFFNPVHRLELVEVVRPNAAEGATLARAVQFVQWIGKVPVVVRDAPGFVVNRVLMPYLAAAGQCFEDGTAPEEIDEAMVAFGMPIGPLRLLDEVGADVALQVAEYLAGQFGQRLSVPAVLRGLVAQQQLGRKSGAGFYLYPGKPRVNPVVRQFVSSRRSPALSAAALQERLLGVLIAEAERCLAEGVVASADDLDFAMVLGTGFAPYTGGPLQYAQRPVPTPVRNVEPERSAA